MLQAITSLDSPAPSRRTVAIDIVPSHLDGVFDHGIERRRDHIVVVPGRIPSQVIRQDLSADNANERSLALFMYGALYTRVSTELCALHGRIGP